MFRTAALIVCCWGTLATTASGTVIFEIADTSNNNGSTFAAGAPISVDLQVLTSNPDDVIRRVAATFDTDAPLELAATPVLDIGPIFYGPLFISSLFAGGAPGDLVDGTGFTFSADPFPLAVVQVGEHNNHPLVTLTAELNSGLPVGSYEVSLTDVAPRDPANDLLPFTVTPYTINVVPEPATLVLLALGAALVGAPRRSSSTSRL